MLKKKKRRIFSDSGVHKFSSFPMIFFETLGILVMKLLRPARCTQNLDGHRSNTPTDHLEFPSCCLREVNNPPLDIRATIGNPYDDGTLEVGHAHFRPKRKDAMGRRHPLFVEHKTVGHALPMKAVTSPIERCLATDEVGFFESYDFS